MSAFQINCANIKFESYFWRLYLDVLKPEGSECFGKNLNALWDALSGGGPSWPGEEVESISLVNTSSIKKINGGHFYSGLVRIARDLKQSSVTFEVE